MSWQLGLSRFIHGCPAFADAPSFPAPSAGSRLPAEREARLLPALIATLFDLNGSFANWLPTRVTELLDWAGEMPGRHDACASRGAREALLLEGLAALDAGLLRESGARFETLSPVLRGHVLDAFECGELGLARDTAARFIDGLVHAVTFAFLNIEPPNFELDLTAWPGAGAREVGRA